MEKLGYLRVFERAACKKRMGDARRLWWEQRKCLSKRDSNGRFTKEKNT